MSPKRAIESSKSRESAIWYVRFTKRADESPSLMQVCTEGEVFCVCGQQIRKMQAMQSLAKASSNAMQLCNASQERYCVQQGLTLQDTMLQGLGMNAQSQHMCQSIEARRFGMPAKRATRSPNTTSSMQ